MSRSQIVSLTILTEGGLLAAAILLAWWFGIPLWSKIEFNFLDIFYGLIAGLIMTALAIWLLQSSWKIFDQLKRDSEKVVHLLENLNLGLILFVSLAAGICEELMFRGVLQPLFSGWFGTIPGIILPSLLFGIVHYVSVSYVIYVSFFGIIFGLMYLWLDNLIAPIVAHAIYDFFMFVWGVRVLKGRTVN